MHDISDLSSTIIPKSDQLNADQLVGGPITITITNVRGDGGEQPVVINYEGDNGRPYKPCKSMRKVLIFAWGKDGREWIGRSMTLFNNPDVMYGGVKVGGIRISHLSHIDRDIVLSLAKTRGKKEEHFIKKLVVKQPAKTEPTAGAAPAATGHGEAEVKAAKRALMAAAGSGTDALKAAWGAIPASMRKAISPDGTCPAKLKEIAAEANATAERKAEEERQAQAEAARMAAAAAAPDDDWSDAGTEPEQTPEQSDDEPLNEAEMF